MTKKRIISYLLLGLLLLVNWHNSSLHAHHVIEENRSDVSHHHHGHSHHNSNHHHHEEPGIWDLINQFLGDFEHPDQGENHLEIFPHPGNPILLDLPTVIFQPFSATLIQIELSESDFSGESKIAIEEFLIADPPFLESTNTRGPPLFS